MATPSDVQAVWARLLVDALASSGVAHVVLSPGSRSTPLVVALVREPRLRIHDVVDERSAAFVALGIARATGRPATLVCTSGSAVAHYHPAIAEAAASELPVVVLSANRPFAFQHAGESQTIDQTKLFGDAVRFFSDLGEPSARELDLRAMRRVVAQAVAASLGPLPGPTHLDARFVKPLEPPVVADAAHEELADGLVARGLPRIHASCSSATDDAVAALADRLATARKPMIVVGPRRSSAVAAPLAAIARDLLVPVFVDPASNLRFHPLAASFCGATDAVLRSPTFLRDEAPDLVVQVGRAPIATGYAALAVASAPDVVALDAHRYLDPFSLASEVVLGDEADALVRLAAALGARRLAIDPAWARRVRELDARAFAEAARLVDVGHPTEGGVARALVGALPEGARLVLGNSLAIREVDDYVPPTDRAIEVLSQRGASGIDGLVAGLVGSQLAAPRPSALLLGDVSLLHDVGSLVLLARAAAPTVVVVVDNGGGRIFEQLPIAARLPEAMPHFVTPPEVDFVDVARAFGLAAVSVDTIGALAEALADGLARAGGSLVRVRVAPHGADEQNRALFRAVDEAAARRR